MILNGVAWWKDIKAFIVLFVLGFALFELAVAQWTPFVLFEDRFETDQGWEKFEEIVDCPFPYTPECLMRSCYYDQSIPVRGEVSRSPEYPFDGSYSLRVWANKGNVSNKYNHVIAQKRLLRSGLTGRLFYSMRAYIPDGANDGETGPEFSMQNTRRVDGQFLTTTAGIQYVPPIMLSTFTRPAKWNVWTATNTLGRADWTKLTEIGDLRLTPGQWYYLAIEADYTTNRYVRFYLWDGPSLQLSVDMSAYSIVQERKFNEEAFWLTLEAQNISRCRPQPPNPCNCPGAPFNYRVYYDRVQLRRICP